MGLLLVTLLCLGRVLLATAQAQGPRTLVLQDAATTGNGTDLNTVGYSVVSVVVSGVAAGANRVVTFNVSVDGTLFENVLCRNVKDGSQATSQTASGTTVFQWTCPCPGMQKFRAVVSGGSTGAVNVTASALPQVSSTPLLPTSGTGSGTVTSIATTSPITGGTITSTGTIACATCALTTGKLSQFAATTSAELAGVLSDETGTGKVVFSDTPEFTTLVLLGNNVGLDWRDSGTNPRTVLSLSSSDTVFFGYAASADLFTIAGGALHFYPGNVDKMTLATDGSLTIVQLATTGAATGKTVVCADTAGKLYRSTSGVACAN